MNIFGRSFRYTLLDGSVHRKDFPSKNHYNATQSISRVGRSLWEIEWDISHSHKANPEDIKEYFSSLRA